MSTASQFNGSYSQANVTYQILLEACEWEKAFSKDGASNLAHHWAQHCESVLAQPNLPDPQRASWRHFHASALSIQAWYLRDSAPELALPLLQQAVAVDGSMSRQWPKDPGRLRSVIKLIYLAAETADKLKRPAESIGAVQQALKIWQGALPEARTTHSVQPLLELGVLLCQSADRTSALPLVQTIHQMGLALKQTGQTMDSLGKFITP